MATLASLKKQMAALEARMAKATKAEMGGAIDKVRKIMADFGLTVEHLAGGATHSRPSFKKGAASKAATKAASEKVAVKGKSSKPPKYRHPSTGTTWSGVGRAPGWIVDSKNREEFLILKAAKRAAAAKTVPAKKVAKATVSVKRAMAAAAEKKAAREVPEAVTAAAPAAKSAKKVTAKKSAAEKAPRKTLVKKALAKKAASKKTSAKKMVTVNADAQPGSSTSAG